MPTRRARKRQPLTIGENGDALDDGEDDYFDDVEYGDASGAGQSSDDLDGYSETAFETNMVRSCGGCLFIFLGIRVLSWTVHAIPVATVTDIPPYARSMLWMSIAHHTNAWQEMQTAFSPPPPAFGDGRGNFPDTQR